MTFFFSLYSCDKNDLKENNFLPKSQMQLYLKENGEIYKDGKLNIISEDNDYIAHGTLNWDLIYSYNSKDALFYYAPFKFTDDSLLKGKKYGITFKVDIISGDIKQAAFTIDMKLINDIESLHIQQYYSFAGELINTWLDNHATVEKVNVRKLTQAEVNSMMENTVKNNKGTSNTLLIANSKRDGGCTYSEITVYEHSGYMDKDGTYYAIVSPTKRFVSFCRADTGENEDAGGGSGGGGFSYNNISNDKPNIIIDSLQKHPLADCVYKALMSNSLNKGLKNILNAFDNSKIYNVTFKVVDEIHGIDGSVRSSTAYTNSLGNGNYEILIRNDIGDFGTVIASTMIHEAFHARLMQKMYAEFGQNNIGTWNNIKDKEIDEVYKIYKTLHLNGRSVKSQEAHHVWMTQNINLLAESLREFVQYNYPSAYSDIGSDISFYISFIFYTDGGLYNIANEDDELKKNLLDLGNFEQIKTRAKSFYYNGTDQCPTY